MSLLKLGGTKRAAAGPFPLSPGSSINSIELRFVREMTVTIREGLKDGRGVEDELVDGEVLSRLFSALGALRSGISLGEGELLYLEPEGLSVSLAVKEEGTFGKLKLKLKVGISVGVLLPFGDSVALSIGDSSLLLTLKEGKILSDPEGVSVKPINDDEEDSVSFPDGEGVAESDTDPVGLSLAV